MKANNAFFRQLLFLLLLITIGIVIFKQLSFLLGSFLGAITLYIVLRGPLFWMTEKHRWKRWIAAVVLVLGMTVLLLALGFLVFEVVASEIPNINTSKIVAGVNSLLETVNGLLGTDLEPRKIVTDYTSIFTRLGTTVLNTTYNFAINVFLMLVVLYFMLLRGRRLEQQLSAYRPFRGESWDILKKEVKNMIFSNAIGIPVVMLGQGLAAALVYWILGLDNVVFWAFITALCGLIPMIGTVIVSVPLGVYLIAGGEIWQGIALIACGLLVIANVDNLLRIILLKKAVDIHPLIVIFGVILGIPLFGFWGIIFGPLLVSGFLLLIRIYYREYQLINPPADKKSGTDLTQSE